MPSKVTCLCSSHSSVRLSQHAIYVMITTPGKPKLLFFAFRLPRQHSKLYKNVPPCSLSLVGRESLQVVQIDRRITGCRRRLIHVKGVSSFDDSFKAAPLHERLLLGLGQRAHAGREELVARSNSLIFRVIRRGHNVFQVASDCTKR
jgi:hypothetical protein